MMEKNKVPEISDPKDALFTYKQVEGLLVRREAKLKEIYETAMVPKEKHDALIEVLNAIGILAICKDTTWTLQHKEEGISVEEMGVKEGSDRE